MTWLTSTSLKKRLGAKLSENPDQWKDMLRAILGDSAADEVISQMEAQGIDPSKMVGMPGGMGGMDLSAAMNSLRAMLSGPTDGPVNWTMAEQVARQSLAQGEVDTLTNGDVSLVKEHLELASMWLNDATSFDSVYGPLQAWTRLDWIAHAQSTFRRLTEPVAENVSRAFSTVMEQQMGELPEDMKAMMGGQIPSIMSNMMSGVSAVQYGTALATLAQNSFGSTDTGLPFVEGHTSALVPANIKAYAADLEIPYDEVQLYVAIREQAHARLFAHSNWLKAYLLDTVAAWARDITIDLGAVEEQVRNIDMTSGQMPEIDITDLFSMNPTESQQAVLTQLETILALIEGWVSHVTAEATKNHLPHADALRELFVRRRATSGPAEIAFGSLVGLELRPRKLREAANFWSSFDNADERDHYWSHPDLLPDSDNLDNLAEFLTSDSDLTSEIDELLAGIFADDEAGEEQKGPEEPLPPEAK